MRSLISRPGISGTIALSLCLTACSRGDVIETHATARDLRVVSERVFWVDSDTLAFAGKRIGREADGFSLYLWTPDAGPEQVHAAGVWPEKGAVQRHYFCAAAGEVAYSRMGSGEPTSVPGQVRFVATAGTPGSEVQAVRSSAYLNGDSGDLSTSPRGLLPYNHLWSVFGRRGVVDRCDEHADPAMVGKYWAATSAPDVAMVFDRRTHNLQFHNARLLNKTTGVETALPIPDGVTAPSCVSSTPWDRATWFWTCRLGGSPEVPPPQQTVWRLDPTTAELTAFEVPTLRSTFFVSFVATRAGLFFFSSDTADEDGFFNFVDGQRRLLVRGEFVDAYVSPDGCHVALAEAISYQPADNRLVVVDVCQAMEHSRASNPASS